MYTLHCGDCLDIMPTLEAGSIDAIICDPPYGTTACKWDSVIPFEPMWANIKRLIKQRGAVVLFGSQPFTSALVMSNPKWFKYCWVWDKVSTSSGLNARIMPLSCHEDICIFACGSPSYTPQMEKGKQWSRGGTRRIAAYSKMAAQRGAIKENKCQSDFSDVKYPKSIITLSNADKTNVLHPTQKPVDLMAYLIRTYTNPGETVLDFTMGSGSTGVAAIQEGRRFIGIEKDAGYFEIAQKRIGEATRQPALLEGVL